MSTGDPYCPVHGFVRCDCKDVMLRCDCKVTDENTEKEEETECEPLDLKAQLLELLANGSECLSDQEWYEFSTKQMQKISPAAATETLPGGVAASFFPLA